MSPIFLRARALENFQMDVLAFLKPEHQTQILMCFKFQIDLNLNVKAIHVSTGL